MEPLVIPAVIGVVAVVWLRMQQSKNQGYWLNQYPTSMWYVTYVATFLAVTIVMSLIFLLSPLLIGALIIYGCIRYYPVDLDK